MSRQAEIKRRLIERDGLRCAVTGEPVVNADALSIGHLIPRSKGGTDDLDNLILVKHEVNATVSADELRRTRLLLQELKERQNELAERELESFERERAYRSQLEQQQRELEESRARLRKEQSDRELKAQADLEDQRRQLEEQWQLFQAQFRASEQTQTERLTKLEEERRRLLDELQQREQLLQLSLEELEHEKKRYTEESRRKIESNSAAYVNEAIGSLDSTAKTYHSISRNWSLVGLGSLLLGVGTAGYFGLLGLGPTMEGSSVEWSKVVFFAFKGLIVVGLFIAIAKYCFSYSQSFMHESIKNDERKHAINFGKFYLESYGANAEWSQIRDAFEHWNIAPSSAFAKDDSDKFDPQIIERAARLVESVTKLRSARPHDPDSSKNP